MLKVHCTGPGEVWSRPCDTCRSAASAVYCRADQAYLCAACDSRVHAANQVASRHERVRVCEACERAPAALLCKADSASLCAACDAEVHSANPLARRHHRVPIVPLYSPSSDHLSMIGRPDDDDEFLTVDGDPGADDEDEDEAASWLLFGVTAVKDEEEDKGVFGREVDEYLDLDDYNCHNNNGNGNNNHQFSDGYSSHNQQYSSVNQRGCYGGDSVVPIQFHKGKDDHQCFQLGLEAYSAASISHSVSLSPMDVGIVPESSMTEISTSHSGSCRPPKGTIDLFSGPPIQLPSQLTGVDREARVLRYREKKKNRKFEKTIRYASRKAYAESRPRIKGRFAKRTDVSESGYGVVPSF